MNRYILGALLLATGLYVFPAWHEHTANACAAMNKLIGDNANAQVLHPSPYINEPNSLDSLMRNASGGIAVASLAAYLPPLPASVGCVIGYWHVMLTPDLGMRVAWR